MRVFLVLSLLMFPSLLIAAPAEQDEIVIELTGTPDKKVDGVSVWARNEQQLTRLFKGKTRTDVLYQVNSVSSADKTLKNAKKERFFLVRYGSDDGDYRKFLFDANEHFLAVADNVKTALRLQSTYQIDFGITETDFVNTFQESGVLTNLADFSHHRDYQTYQLPNLKGLPRYVAFLDGKLINMYADEKTFNQFVTDLSAQNKEFLATQKQEEKQRLLDTQKAREEELNKRSRVRMSALVSGGTVQDQMYMPRLVKKQTETKQSVAP